MNSQAKTGRRWFDWVMPASWRPAPLVEPPVDDSWVQAIRNAPETEPILRGLITMARRQFEDDNMIAISQKVPTEERIYVAGRAAAMLDFLGEIEACRRAKPPES